MKLILSALIMTLAVALTSAAQAAGPVKVMFVDTGNTGRSITAETVAETYARTNGLSALFISRGVDTNPFDRHVEANAQVLWKQRGVDLSGHLAGQLDAQDVKHADVILTLTAKHKARVVAAYPDAAAKTFTLAEYAEGVNSDIEDAWGKPMDVYVKMFAAVDRLVPMAVNKAVAAAR